MDHPLFSSALSVEASSTRAEEAATRELLQGLPGRSPNLLAAFVSHHHGNAIEELGPRLARRTGAKVVIGCTGEGIIGGDREVEHEPALSLWAAYLPDTTLRPFAISAYLGPDRKIGFHGLPEINDRSRASMLLLADPYSFPMDEFLSWLNTEHPGVPAAGGMASGGTGPGQNLLITSDGVLDAGAVGCVLEGGVEVRSVVSQGCRPVGTPWVITACKDNLIEKLGGRGAGEVVAATMQGLSESDRELFRRAPFIGLAIDANKSRFERGDFLVRGILGLDRTGMAINDQARRGMTIQFLVRDADSASEDLTFLMGTQGGGALTELPGPRSAGALLFSCNGRGTRMFDAPNHDIGCVRGGLRAEIPVAGFFAAGEVGPVGGRNFLHGFTASVFLFRPRPLN